MNDDILEYLALTVAACLVAATAGYFNIKSRSQTLTYVTFGVLLWALLLAAGGITAMELEMGGG